MAHRSASSCAACAGSFLLILVALFFSLVIVVTAGGRDSLRHTMEQNQEIHADFQAAARFVGAYRRQRGRLPDFTVMMARTTRLGPITRHIDVLVPSDSHFEDEAIPALGTPPPAGFVLTYYRGGWREYYASWSDRSTMPLDQSAYFMFGSPVADLVFSVIAIVLCLLACSLLWSGTLRKIARAAFRRRPHS